MGDALLPKWGMIITQMGDDYYPNGGRIITQMGDALLPKWGTPIIVQMRMIITQIRDALSYKWGMLHAVIHPLWGGGRLKRACPHFL